MPSATPLLDTVTSLACVSNTSASVLAKTLLRLEVGKSKYSAQFGCAEMLRSVLLLYTQVFLKGNANPLPFGPSFSVLDFLGSTQHVRRGGLRDKTLSSPHSLVGPAV